MAFAVRRALQLVARADGRARQRRRQPGRQPLGQLPVPLAEAAQRVRILYGGSMKPDNAPELLKQPDIDGGLIGGASLQAASFLDLVKAGATAKA